MADEPEDDILELGEPPEEQDEAAVETNDEAEQPADDDIETPTFADDGEEEPTDTDLVKHLRAELRRTQADKKALEQGVKPEPAIVVGPEPSLEDPDVEWDEAKFKEKFRAWEKRKEQAEAQANKGQEAQRAADAQWEEEKAAFAKRRAALPYKDIDDVEAVVAASLEPAQTALIVKAANDAPKLIYALGKNPGKLAALASIKDPIKFIAATVRLEAEVKMAKRRPSVEPDKIVRGSASVAAGAADKQVAALEKEAERTGDRSKLIAYRAKQRAA